MQKTLSIRTIGRVRRIDANRSALEIDDALRDALAGIVPDERLDVSYWMHELSPEDRNRRQAHPRGDRTRPLRGVFALRSPMRPNPIGVTTVSVESIDGTTVTVRGLDAFDNAPLIDIKAARRSRALDEVIAAWGSAHDAMVRSLFALLSPGECREMLQRPMRRAGAEAAGETESPLPLPEIGRRIMDFESHWNIRGRVAEDSQDAFVREVSHCPWAEFHPTSCRILALYMEGFVQALNPDCRYELEALMPAGDTICRWSLHR